MFAFRGFTRGYVQQTICCCNIDRGTNVPVAEELLAILDVLELDMRSKIFADSCGSVKFWLLNAPKIKLLTRNLYWIHIKTTVVC